MTRDDIIRMAREAGVHVAATVPELERFADLVEEHLIQQGYRKCAKGQRTTQFCGMLEDAVKAERERIKQANAPEIEKVNAHIKMLEDAVLAEREACAKVCEQQSKVYDSNKYTTDPLGGYRERFAATQCAADIRARSKT